MLSFVKYGDIIMINHERSETNNSKAISGFMSGTGFLDKNLYFQTVDQEENKLGAQKSNYPNIINTRDLLWKICPQLDYQFHRDYHKISQE